MSRSTDITGSICPDCGYEFELATEIGGDSRPASGDVSICVSCGAVLVFTVSDTGTLGMRKPDRAELADIYRQNPEILDIQRDTYSALQEALQK